MTPDDFLADSPLGLAVFHRVEDMLSDCDDVETKTSKTQVAFRRGRGFAYIWLPGQHLERPDAEVVLSIAVGRKIDSSRFKEVAHPSKKIWQHHLEIADVDDLDDEFRGWLMEAYEDA